MIDPEKILYLEEWAQRNKCALEEKGEVGFGSPCVGIIWGTHYVDFNFLYEEDIEAYKLLSAPEDAYHKSDNLAVLVYGEDEADYDRALEQLYTWVKHLNDNGFVVEVAERRFYNTDRQGILIEALFHGTTMAKLVRRK